jgi:hypothetical protein
MKKSIIIAVLVVIIILVAFITYYYNITKINNKASPFYTVSNSAELLNVTEHYVNITNHFTINYSGTADIIFSKDSINVTLNVPIDMSFQKSGKLGLFQLYANLTKAYNFFSAFTGAQKEQNYMSVVLLYNSSGIIECSNITGEMPQNCTFNNSKTVIDTIKNDLEYALFRSYANSLFDTGVILNLGNSSFPVKFIGTESYNGNTCSIFDINFSSSNADGSGNLCFSLDFTLNGYTSSSSSTAITSNYKVIFKVNSNPISYSNISIAADNAAGYLK